MTKKRARTRANPEDDVVVPVTPAEPDSTKRGARPAHLADTETVKHKGRDVVMAGYTATSRKKFGDENVMTGRDSDSLIIAIPCPAFAFEYLISQSGIPLGLMFQLVAKHGVGKSGLLAEMGRWFSNAAGAVVLCENETKHNPEWFRSIMGRDNHDRMVLHTCDSIDDWQKRLTDGINDIQRLMTGTRKEPGPGRTFPVLFGVDSVMGKPLEETQEKIVGVLGKDGMRGTTGTGSAPARGYPVEAGAIARYMRVVPQMIAKWPFSLVFVNHLRINKDDQGNPERSKSGGVQMDFQESFELELRKHGGHKKRIVSQYFEGTPLVISCEKNSFGSTHRMINTRVLWWHEEDPETGNPVQRTVWDWDWSTVHLLSNLLSGESSGTSTYYRQRLKDIGFHLETPRVGEVDNLAWSKTLGMSANDALPWSEVGALLREDKALLNRLRDALGIVKRPMLEGQYHKQREALRKKMR